MTSTKQAKAQAILEKEERHSIGVRQNMAKQMQALNYGAVIWSESLFGSTNYPLITTASGRTYNVHGVMLNSAGGVCAIVDYPTGEYITGVKAFPYREASKFISPSMLICSGTPEEWDVLGDCFSTAIHILHVEVREEQPLPWW